LQPGSDFDADSHGQGTATMTLEILRAHDAQMVELNCGRGSVLIPPSLGGRIFCQFDGELMHRLDVAALKNPSPTEYDNLGGNSLWPAPEGGPFAFNYLPDSDAWRVQDGIAKAIPTISRDGEHCARMEKQIVLTNRKGVNVHLDYRRMVTVPDSLKLPSGYALEGMCYHTEDIFEPRGEYSADDVLLAPWSLEQFPGAEGIVAFGKTVVSKDALNCDFYGDPGERLARRPGHFTFRLGGEARHQIGVRVQSRPQFIGALDVSRSLLILRRTEVREGVYFNIADNEQPDGPFSATDLYSIFNGGELGFYELETIGAMRVVGGRVSAGVLSSQTLILRGSLEELLQYLSDQGGLHLDKSVLPKRS
jgi:hypothetical protein